MKNQLKLLSLAVVMVALTIVLNSSNHNRLVVNYQAGTTGVDVSWPNCKTVPAKGAAFGIVGITYGRNYSQSPCLRQELMQFHPIDLYMNTGNVEYDTSHRKIDSPKQCDAKDLNCTSYDYGYNAALYVLHYATKSDLYPSTWWLDVETENTWSDSTDANRQALTGMIDAIHKQMPLSRIGIYSYPAQWKLIVGEWKPKLPAWVATGSLKRQAALDACRQPSFTNGPVILAQYTTKLDQDYVCNSFDY